MSCFICEQSLEEGKTLIVKKKGIETLHTSSVKRKKNEHTRLLATKNEIKVHQACSQAYNDERRIDRYLRGGDDVGKPSSSTASPVMLRSGFEKFQFKGHCFLCGEAVTPEFLKKQTKLPLGRRNLVHLVQMESLKEKILGAAKKRGDDWAQKIIERIPQDLDLVAADAQYHINCQRKLYHEPPSEYSKGYREYLRVETAMEYIYSYLDKNSEECQFSFDELINTIEGDYQIDRRTIKSRLLEKYGEDILIVETANKSTVCLKNTGYKILTENWYQNKNSDPQAERMRVVKAAADIILEDIRSKVYNTTEYPSSNQFLNDIESGIPESLRLLLETVILKNKTSFLDKWKKKCVAISHAVIGAARPRSFLSPLLTGISVFMYRKFGSKLLIDIMSSLGFSSSHHEAQLLEVSSITQPQPPLIKTESTDAFCQLVFDNADFNVNTLDGRGTFHAMGGIICVTPHTAVEQGGTMQRSRKLSASELVSTISSTELHRYTKDPHAGLKTVVIKDLSSLSSASTDNISPSLTELLWLYGKSHEVPNVPGWNGFMEKATDNLDYQRSKIVYLPFINAPPSHYDTVYTSLFIARQKCNSINQKTCFVTFDQPLYTKAQEILHNGIQPELEDVIARLGGFHLLMSYLGAIGTIMAGSGLNELFATIYAENSITKMMSGHAYSRAVRAHLLTHQALARFIMDTIEFTDDERKGLERFLSDVQQSTVLKADECEELKSVNNKFIKGMEDLKHRGPTAQLWVLYYKMVTLVKQYIEAERMGNFQLHLDTVKKMIPFFHATGHWFYAKSAHLYLQEMSCLQDKMDSSEFHKFTLEGYFTIRRTDKFWSGIWTDMTIEQKMMKDMKIGGGLIGRGMTDSTLLKWTLGMTYLQDIAQEIENFTNVTSTSSEQHVEMRPARISRDNVDVQKLHEWFSKHPPFPESDVIMSISSGIVGSDQVNCHKAQEVGMAGVSRIIGRTFGEVSFKKKDKVVTLAFDRNALKVGQKKIAVDPLTLYQRMCIAKQSQEDLQDYLSYELAPFPMSLFNEDGMRKGTKSTLYEAFSPLPSGYELPKRHMIIVDGGYLLHKVVWNRNLTFGGICADYVKYIHKHYGIDVMVVFDGYPEEPALQSTKSAERARRCNINTSADVMFDKTTVNLTPQEKLLSNERNKKRFIALLITELGAANIDTDQADEDADVLIVTRAKSMASKFDAVVIIGEDIDLLVVLTGTPATVKNVYLRKPGRGNSPEVMYSSSSFKYNLQENVMLLHAISGCDTTSNIFGFGKSKFFRLFEKKPLLLGEAEKFRDAHATATQISEAGERILVALYDGDLLQSLTSLRYNKFISGSTKLNLARLPPTPDAAKFHSFRAYHQVMTWLGEKKEPLEWGWKRGNRGLEPITTERDAAPLKLLKTVSCKCATGCMGACGCRKAGLKCSTLCKMCSGHSCENRSEFLLENDDDEEDVDPPSVFQEELNIESTSSTVRSHSPSSKRSRLE